jgi:uncharacterized protein (DUF1697 family)
MPRYIALLRAINVGGHVVKMEVLRSVFERLGFQDVETFIASGNVIFTSTSRTPGALEKKIEAALERELGYEVSTFLRTDAELAAASTCRPFPAARIEAARTWCVGFLAAPLDAAAKKALAGLCNEADELHTNGREVYWISSMGQNEARFSNAALERALRTRSTFRGMKTVERLAARYPPQSGPAKKPAAKKTAAAPPRLSGRGPRASR